MASRAARAVERFPARAGFRVLVAMVAITMASGLLSTVAISPASARPVNTDGRAEGREGGSAAKKKEVPRCGPVVGLGAAAAPKLTAKAWTVVDAGTGRILASCRAHDRLAPASTQKVLTALALLPKLDPNSVYTARKQDAGAEGAGVGLLPGHGYTINQLAHGLILRSGNDAASALANAFGGWKTALPAINAEAARLGAMQTEAKNPSGLDAPGQLSTAADLATIFRAAIAEPRVRRLLCTREADFPLIVERKVGEQEGDRKIRREVRPGRIGAIDPLVWNRYPGLVGGKTGYTTNAGRTYVAAVKRDGKTMIVSLLGYTEATQDEAHVAFSWAFANAHLLSGVEQIPAPRSVVDELPGSPAGSATGSNAGVAGDPEDRATSLAGTNSGVAFSDAMLISGVVGGLSVWYWSLFLIGLLLAGVVGLLVRWPRA